MSQTGGRRDRTRSGRPETFSQEPEGGTRTVRTVFHDAGSRTVFAPQNCLSSEEPSEPKKGTARTAPCANSAFLLTIGSFLLAVELLSLQRCLRALTYN